MRFFRAIGLIGAILFCGTAFAQVDVISTFAGGGPNNLPALQSNLDQATGVAVDSAGNVYVVDRTQHDIFKVTPSGTLTLLAGNGAPGYSGDGGPAGSAYLDSPTGIAVDGQDNIYICDTGNEVIRRIDAATGTITTVAGSATYGFAGDGGPATSAQLARPQGIAVNSAGTSLYIADIDNQRVRKVDLTTGTITTVAGSGIRGFSGDGGPATLASLKDPTSVAVDNAGNFYIGDSSNFRVRRVDTSGVITTVAGNGSGGYSGDGGPATDANLSATLGVAVDSRGFLYIADTGNARIRTVDPYGVISTVAGNGCYGYGLGTGCGDLPTSLTGPATGTSLADPLAVTLDGTGNMFIADTSNRRIRKVTYSTQLISTLAGNGLEVSGDGYSAIRGTLNVPQGVAVDSGGNVYIADTTNNRIRKVNTSGIITTVAGTGTAGFSGDGGLATSAELAGPIGVAVDSTGNLYIADTRNQRIRRVDAVTQFISTVAGNGCAGYAVSGTSCAASTSAGDGSPAIDASLNFPQGVAVDASGSLFIADLGNHRIRKVDGTGTITTVAGTGTAGFTGDNGPAASAELNFPAGIALDASGNLFIADQFNNRIREVNAGTQTMTTVAGDGEARFNGDGFAAASASLSYPAGVSVDRSDNLFIADVFNQRIRRVDGTSGNITTVAGNGSPGFSGDGGQAIAAMLSTPSSVAADGSGNVYIADTGNNRVRKITDASGTGAQPAASPTSLTFSDLLISGTSDPQTVTLSNNGTAALAITGIATSGDYALASNQCGNTLAAATDCTVDVTFTPTASGTRTGTLTFTDNATSSPQTVALTGNGLPGPVVSLSPPDLKFANQAVKTTSASQTVTLTNTGSEDLTISTIVVSADFAETHTCGATVSAGGSCTITVTFTPSVGGTITGAVTLSDNAGDSPQAITLTGTGTAPQVYLSVASLNLGSLALGKKATAQPVSVTNVGNAPMTFTSIAIAGNASADYTQTNNCASPLNVSASCSITVSFTPTASGTRSAAVVITDDALYGPQQINLTGTGIGPELTLSANSLSFGRVGVNNTSVPQTVTLTNSGVSAMSITGIAASGEFAQTNTCGSSLAVGASCTISVTFSPTTAGDLTGAVTIADNAAASPQTIQLSGTGGDFAIAPASGSATSATVSSGQSATYTLTLDPGGFSGPVAFACAVQPSGPSCSVSPNPVNLDGKTPATVTVTVSTRAFSTGLPRVPAPPALPPAVLWTLLAGLVGSAAVVVHRLKQPERAWARSAAAKVLLLAPFAALLLGVTLWASCGGGGGSANLLTGGTQPGTYTVTVTGTAGNLSHNTTLTLTVQ